MTNFYSLETKDITAVKKLIGPVVVFGAGGFIGANLLKTLTLYRSDVLGISQNPQKNWRFKNIPIPPHYTQQLNILNRNDLERFFEQYKPKTIFNLAAYGAYSKQADIDMIHATNYMAHIHLLELSKKHGINAYIYAGSSSEYGLNATRPKEDGELLPNSQYAVSKIAAYYANKYYVHAYSLPVIHLRLYSVYGPWEEPDRLIPTLLQKARAGFFPPLADPLTTRDFIFINDVTEAFIRAADVATKKKYLGETFNIATGKKTTLKELAHVVKRITFIKTNPQFSKEFNRAWDTKDWVGNPLKAKRLLQWQYHTLLVKGLMTTLEWQKQVNYDTIIA